MNRLFTLLAVLFIILFSTSTHSQVAGYTFTQSSQTYTEITGGTMLVGGGTAWDDNSFTNQPIGFTFNYNGTNYTTFSMNGNGFIALGAAIANSYCPMSTGTTNNVIVAFGTDIRSNTGGVISEMRYQTLGCPPNRYTVIQWKDCMMFAGTTNDHYNFQIILYETPNTIEVRYGSFIQTTTQTGTLCAGSTPADPPSVGIRGTTNADFSIRQITNGVETWTTSIAGGVNTSRCQTSGANIPPSGTSFAWRFTVPVVPPTPPPLSGTYIIDNTGAGNYLSFTSAINDLNCRGISGPVTFNVVTGQTFDEVLPPAITTTGTATNTITFQRSGGGANPILRGMNGISLATTSQDACINISGGDYFTFDGIDCQDHPGNVTTTTKMEYGYLLRNNSAIDGAQNNTIKNCAIDLRNNILINTNSMGVGSTATTSFGGGVTPTNLTGANSNNKIQNVTISNVYNGIRFRNGAATFACQNNEISGCNVGGNVANSIGNSSTTTHGIWAEYQSGINIFNNNVNNVTQTSTLNGHGIYLQNDLTGTYAACNIYNNEIRDIKRTTSTSSSGLIYGIRFNNVTGVVTNCYNNIVHSLQFDAPTVASATPVVFGINCTGAGTFNISYNSVNLNVTDPEVTGVCLSVFTGTPIIKNNALSNQSPVRTGVARNWGVYRSSGGIDPTSSCNVIHILNGVGVTGFTGNYVGAVPTDRNGLPNLQSAPYTATPATFETFLMGSSVNNPNFTSATNLTFTAGSSLANSGDPIGSITVDKNGVTRDGTNPDIGAYEDGAITVTDSHGPRLSYTPIVNSANPVLNLTVTDNVNGAVADARLWYRIATSGAAFTGLAPDVVPGTRNGTYTWNTSLAGLPAGNYEYYIAVRDGSTNNTTITPMCLNTAAPVFDVDPNPANYTVNPLVGVNWRTFTKSSVLSGGLYAIGPSGPYGGYVATFANLTTAAAQLNGADLTGNVIFELQADYTDAAEVYPIIFNQYANTGGPWSATIRPVAGAPTLVTDGDPGTGLTQGLIILNGVDNLTLDGRAGGVDSPNKIGETDAASEEWIIRNTRTLATIGPVITLQNDATGNTLTYLQIEGQSNTSTTASIYFGTTTGTTGNDNNTISFCDIRDRSDVIPGSGMPAQGIMSLGTTTTVTHYNSGNAITNNNFFDIFQNVTFIGPLRLDNGNETWNITGNSFYHTGTRTVTVTATTYHLSLFMNNSSQFGINFTGNYIGGSAPLCGSGPMTFTSGLAINYLVYGIQTFTNNLVTASSIQGNTIQNISITNNTQTVQPIFRGIYNQSTGLVNTGNITGNTIGSGTGNGSISLNYPSMTTTPPLLIGINHLGVGSVSNNTIGSIDMAAGPLTTTGTVQWTGITASGTTAGQSMTINNNVIGSLTTANSIRQTGLLPAGSYRGIVTSNGAGMTVNITNNTIANVTDLSTSATNLASNYGIQNSGAGTFTFSNNVVRNLTINMNGSTASFMLGGIFSTGAGSNTFTQNQIYSLYSNGTGAGSILAGGILAGGATGGTVSRNKIYDFRFAGTGSLAPGPLLLGINCQSSGVYTFSNNMISLSNDDASLLKNNNLPSHDNINLMPVQNNSYIPVQNNPVQNSDIQNSSILKRSSVNSNTKNSVRNAEEDNATTTVISAENVGLYSTPEQETMVQNSINNAREKSSNNSSKISQVTPDASSLINTSIAGIYHTNTNATTGCNYYYNSFYVGGNQPGSALDSWCFTRTSTGTVNFRNNLFVNARTGGTGQHYCISNQSLTPATGWNANASNYNVFLGSNAATIGEWSVGIDQTIDVWRTSSSGDKQTWSTTTADMNPTNLFTNISTCDLNLLTNNDVWICYGKGIAITGQSIDYDGNARATTIAGGCTDIGADEVTASVTELPPLPNQDIAPGAGVTSTYSRWGRTFCVIDWGIGGSSYPTNMTIRYYSGRNPNNVSGGNYANSYTDVSPVGTLTDAYYNYTHYFGDNEIGTINTPATNTVLAKKNSTTWDVFPPGVNPAQTQLVYNTGTHTYTAKVDGLPDFSEFALSDNTSPLPVVISEFNVAVNSRDANLMWITSHELNNKGFAVERRIKLAGEKVNYSQWKEVAFINGNGTTNEPKTYHYSDKKLNSGIYQYRLRQVDYNNNFEYFSPSQSDIAIGKPGTFDLSQNYPNPSNPVSKIDFQMPFDGKVSIKVYDILGQEVKTLVDEFKTADFYTVVFDGSNLASAVYFYRIIAEGNGQKFTKTLKMVLVK